MSPSLIVVAVLSASAVYAVLVFKPHWFSLKPKLPTRFFWIGEVSEIFAGPSLEDICAYFDGPRETDLVSRFGVQGMWEAVDDGEWGELPPSEVKHWTNEDGIRVRQTLSEMLAEHVDWHPVTQLFTSYT